MTDPEIFILDRNPLHGNMLRFQLALKKISRVQVFHSVEECLYRIRKQPTPDYLITEYDLGEYNGLEFLRMVRKISPGTEIIFFSTMDDEAIARQLLDEGATDFILKGKRLDTSILELVRNLQFIQSEKEL